VLLFHCGPAKYKKAYQALLDDFRHPTPADARRKHLDKLDLTKLRNAVRKFKSSKIKYADVK
jgi:hypothetical protein